MERLSTISINGFRLSLALLLLNSALTFQNRWPTAGVRWVLELSLDLIVLLLALAVAWRRPPGRWGRVLLLGGVILLTLGRYVDVTAPALMGRSVHLYWDSQHLPQVATMLIDSVAGWQLALGGLVLLLAGGALVVMLRWALNTVIAALDRPVERRVLGVLATVLLTLYGAGRLTRLPTEHGFALPVTPVFIEQIRLALDATVFRDQGWIAAQPPLPALNLKGRKPGDVFVIFFESYGALVFDDPRFAAPLAGKFAALEQSLEPAGWQVASARLESSTFGGGSWLAHASLLSGLRIADQGDYRDLLVSDRQTVVRRFADAGYRTVAVMPGLRYAWPEGQFYGFTETYSAERLDYRGPAYGWWVIPDQYSLYRIHRTELDPVHRPPLFLFFPTINSHAPFAPLPPYQPDWSDFDAPARESAVSGSVELSERLDGAALAPAYLQSILYNLAVLGGYLRQYAPANALFLVLGDHQPPAVVGGREIPWQVPVHVFSRDPAVLEPFMAAGFRPGMVPGPTALGGIERIGPLLLELGHEALPPQPGDIHSEGQRQ
jgi:hypothetical protein